MIYQSGFGRSRLPEANCLLLKKGCRQAFLVQGGSQRQKQTTFTGPPLRPTPIRRAALFMCVWTAATWTTTVRTAQIATCVRSWLSDLFTYSIYLSICGVAAHLKDGIPAKRVGKIFEKSSYGIIRRITPIPRHLPVVEQPVDPDAGFSALLPLQYGQPYGGFDFGYAFSDLQGEQQL